MKIRDLEYVTAAAAAGNFSRAARSLGISASTISRRVGRFEDELGLALFERGHRGVRLTKGGKAVLLHARRAVAELEAIRFTGKQNGIGAVGELRLGVRMPPVAEPMRTLLTIWRDTCPDVRLTVSEMNERDLAIALEERRLDVALAASHMVPPRAAAMPVYREGLFAALPPDHALVRQDEALTWAALHVEAILVQGWEESQAEREFLAPLLGGEVNFQSHAASRQSILALVGAGFGIAIMGEGQAQAGFPGVAFRPIDAPNARVQVDLAWPPETEEPAVGRFVAFVRDAARSRRLLGAGRFREGFDPPQFGEGAVGGYAPRQHRTDQFRRLDGPLAGFASESVGIGDEVAMDRRRQFDCDPQRLVIRHPAELQLGHDPFSAAMGLEGIVSKRADARYAPGNRGLWLKVKCLNREEFVVVGWTDPEGTRPHIGALLLAYYDPDGRLVYAGRVGSGINQAELQRLSRILQALATNKIPLDVPPPRSNRFGSPLVLSRVHWVRPELVAEVKFLTWTTDNLLRQVVYEGLREDK